MMKSWILRGVPVLLLGLSLAVGVPDTVAVARPPDATSIGVPAGGPARVAAYFAKLGPGRAMALAVADPGIVGNLDGAPLADRYEANALRTDRYQGRQILAYSPYGEGQIVEAVGDLSTARRIAVLVPGVDNTLADFDSGLGGVRRRSPAWQARQLYGAAGRDTAVIAWLGYDPPDGIGRAAIRSERAEAGAKALLRFLAGLTAQCPQATVVLIGHSYGTVVLGHTAAQLPPAVTDLVAIGSPGLDVTRAADLHTTARLWAGSDPRDWTLELPDVRILGAGHGTNPTRPGFGALPLDVHDAPGHDGYFEPGTTALASIARVVSAPPRGAAVTVEP